MAKHNIKDHAIYRVAFLLRNCEDRLTVKQLSEYLNLPSQTVGFQIRRLRKLELVRCINIAIRKGGRAGIYEWIDSKPLPEFTWRKFSIQLRAVVI